MSAVSRMSSISCKSTVSKAATYFNIKFENNNDEVFSPGDTINGVVELYVEKKIKKTKGLKLEVIGIAQCSWPKRRFFKSINFEGSQKLMEHISHFFGRVDGTAIEVSVGVHLYNFSCTIPKNAASSYEGSYGSIKYSVKVTLDLPYMRDIVYERPFIVKRTENLNNFPWLRCKSESETDYGDGIDCCETMPLVVSLKIDKSGFAIGEELKIRIEACNQGPAKYSNSILALDRVETYSSHFPVLAYKKSYKIVSYVPSKSIKPFETVFYEEKLIIPDDLLGTSEASSEIVRIGYQLRFSSKSNRRSKVQGILPIFIGHVPFEKLIVEGEESAQSEPVEEPIRNNKSGKILMTFKPTCL